MGGDGWLEAVQQLIIPGVDYPLEISRGGGTISKEEININNSPNSELAESGDTGPWFKIKSMEE